jgi:hypothetical protein
MATKEKEASNGELEAKRLLIKLIEEMELMHRKLDSLIEINSKIVKAQEEQQIIGKAMRVEGGVEVVPDVMSLLSLPISLRKTMMALYKVDKATAEDLSKANKRLRAVESSAANQLVRLGYLGKKREGREVYFYIESAMELEK